MILKECPETGYSLELLKLLQFRIAEVAGICVESKEQHREALTSQREGFRGGIFTEDTLPCTKHTQLATVLQGRFGAEIPIIGSEAEMLKGRTSHRGEISLDLICLCEAPEAMH